MHIEVTLLGEQPRTFQFQGRLGWTLAKLAKAGPHGVTPIECPAPRWSGYVHSLRKSGIPIETELEAHYGTYSGHHARYRLACDVDVRFLAPEEPQTTPFIKHRDSLAILEVAPSAKVLGDVEGFE